MFKRHFSLVKETFNSTFNQTKCQYKCFVNKVLLDYIVKTENVLYGIERFCEMNCVFFVLKLIHFCPCARDRHTIMPWYLCAYLLYLSGLIYFLVLPAYDIVLHMRRLPFRRCEVVVVHLYYLILNTSKLCYIDVIKAQKIKSSAQTYTLHEGTEEPEKCRYKTTYVP